MSKIVYLLGAGASCNCLPTVAQLKDRIQALIDKLRDDEFNIIEQPNLIENKPNSHLIQKFIDDLSWMNELNSNHYSIDTVAKKLFLTGENLNYQRLKYILSNYFLIEQKLNKPDNRYDFFFASVLSHLHKLPKNLKILSWNYDNQFELSFKEYLHDKSAANARSHLKINEKFNVGLWEEKDPFIYKINGSCGISDYNGGSNSLLGFFQLSTNDFVKEVIKHHYIIMSSISHFPSMSFSWEKPEVSLKWIENIMIDCDVLVAIGYSFPFFNREIDKKIFSSGNLEKIYVQNPNAEEIIEKMNGMHIFSRNTQFVPNKSTSEFLIPFEF